MALVGSGLRGVAAGVRRAAGAGPRRCLSLNLIFAPAQSFLGVIPTVASIREVVYAIGNGAATLNAYVSPVAVNPTTPARS